jgi:DNA mismatch repair protein MLH1
MYSHHKVRTSLQERTLDSMFSVANPVWSASEKDADTRAGNVRDIQMSDCALTSVGDLRQAVHNGRHKRTLDLSSVAWLYDDVSRDRAQRDTRNTRFCGDCRRWAMSVAHPAFNQALPRQSRSDCVSSFSPLVEKFEKKGKNFLDTIKSNLGHSGELFYQLGLRQFGNLSRLKLEPPPPLRVMVALAVEAEPTVHRSRMTKEEIIDV